MGKNEEEEEGDERARSPASPSRTKKRLVLRDLPFHQSSNSLSIRHQQSGDKRFFYWYLEDWFHVILRLPTVVSLTAFILVWTAFILIFAGIYIAVDSQDPSMDCGLGKGGEIMSWPAAFAFSLETCTTVGYGLPGGVNAFFENCPGVQVAIYFQMLVSMMFNAFLLAFMFARFARCETRGAQVLFSDKAILNREVTKDGTVRYVLSARLYDADSSYPLVEAHVRFYAVKHRPDRPTPMPHHGMNLQPMRISIPNDDLGATLLTSIPSSVSHHIDYYSPILPPRKKTRGPEDGRIRPDSGFVLDSAGLTLREVDSYTGNRDGLRCVVCGETYATTSNLVQHIRYNQHTEAHDDVPVVGSHQEIDVDAIFGDISLGLPLSESSSEPEVSAEKEIGTTVEGWVADGAREGGGDCAKEIDVETPPAPWFDEFRQYFAESNLEIICVMEAIDPIMSGTFQALHSYMVDDIVFGDYDFAPCLLPDFDRDRYGWNRKKMHSGGGSRWRRALFGRGIAAITVDLDKFHDIVDNEE